MLGLIKTLQKRPSDKSILIARILFWIIYITVLYYNFFLQEEPNTIQNVIFWQELSQSAIEYITYWIIAIWIVPIIMWATNICIAKKKIVRIIQIVFSIVLFYISSLIVSWPNLDIDSLVLLMWFFPLIAWITGKCITSKCLKYWEKVTKIRV